MIKRLSMLSAAFFFLTTSANYTRNQYNTDLASLDREYREQQNKLRKEYESKVSELKNRYFSQCDQLWLQYIAAMETLISHISGKRKMNEPCSQNGYATSDLSDTKAEERTLDALNQLLDKAQKNNCSKVIIGINEGINRIKKQ